MQTDLCRQIPELSDLASGKRSSLFLDHSPLRGKLPSLHPEARHLPLWQIHSDTPLHLHTVPTASAHIHLQCVQELSLGTDSVSPVAVAWLLPSPAETQGHKPFYQSSVQDFMRLWGGGTFESVRYTHTGGIRTANPLFLQQNRPGLALMKQIKIMETRDWHISTCVRYYIYYINIW